MTSNNRTPRYLTMAVHQIKNPIYVLREYIETLSSEEIGELNAKQKEYLQAALENIKNTEDVINDLVETLRMEEKGEEFKKEEVNLGEMIESIVQGYKFFAKANNSNIVFNKPEEKVSPVLTDRKRIKYVVDNLVSNAIQYKERGKEGMVEVSIEEKESEVLFKIKDNGSGIKEEGDKVFSRFYRGKKGIETSPTGIGVGLYISKLVVESSGGKIWYENNEGEDGVTFYFTLLKS